MQGVEESELPQGMRLMDRYVIIDRIAAGGMASIYRATDERLDRVVCVKLLRAFVEGSGSTSGGSAYEASYAHFLKEALALSRLAHPNTLKIHDFGYLEESGRPFQVSEFLDGGTLENHVRSFGPVAPHEIVSILKPIVGALTEAHAQGIVHRDIKPSNILFARVGEQLIPKLADFGIARSDIKKRGASSDEEISVVSLFSPRWAAPEQISGGAQDERTDVYALALVTAFMLSGRFVFEGRDIRASFADRIIGDALVTRRLTELRVAEPVRRALMSGLAASPQRRVASAAEFLEGFRQALREVPHGREAALSVSESSISFETSALGHAEEIEPAHVEELAVGQRVVKLVDVRERLDMSFAGVGGALVRARFTMVPAREGEFRLHIKGLNCFVVPLVGTGGMRPSPAFVADRDGHAEFWTATREPLARVSYTFGQAREGERVFSIDGQELVIPAIRATLSIALFVGTTGEVVVVCSKPRSVGVAGTGG